MKTFKPLVLALLFIVMQHYAYSQVPPTLLLPTNNNNCQSLTIDLKWEPTNLAQSYTVQISEDPDFEDFVLNQPNLTTTELTVSLNDWGKRYWWRVTAVYSGGEMGTSSPFSFYTKAAPVDLVSPNNGILCTDLNVEFNWTKNGAEFYNIRIASDTNFANIVYSKSNITDSTITIKLPNYNTKYFWQVSSLKGTCISEWSLIRTFTTKTALAIQSLPENLSYGTALFPELPFGATLEWQAVENADSYLLQISTDPTFAETEVDTVDLADTTFTFVIGEVYNTTYYWRIAVVVDGCLSDWTNNFSFKTPYRSTNLISPLDNEICVSMVDNLFKWTAVESATKYRIQIADSANFNNILFDIDNITETEVSVLLELPMTEHYWRIKAQDANNNGLWSAARKFRTTQIQPNFVSPVDGAVGLPMEVTLEWEELSALDLFDVRVSADPTFATTIVDTALLASTSLTINLPENNTVYYWQVRARLGSCVGDWSNSYMFKTLIQPPVLLKPDNFSSSVSIYPIFTWEAVDEALSYQIRVSKDSLFSVIYKTSNNINSTSFTFAGEEFEEETTYYWQVRAINSDGISLWSEIFRFSTGTKPANAPLLLSPLNGAIKVPFSEDLIWRIEDEAELYRVQLALDFDFISIVIDSILIDTKMNIAAFVERYTNYHWRVASINKGGQGEWSNEFRFRTKDIAPEDQVQLVSPSNNATELPNFFTFNWAEVDRAFGYELQIATTNNFAEGTVFYSSSSIWQNSKLVYDMPYDSQLWWRVRAWNEDGEAPWSNTWTFSTLNPASVEDFTSETETFAYPNPAIDATYIVFDMDKSVNTNIKIVNMLGREIQKIDNYATQSGENRLQLNTANLVPGIYIFMIEYNGGRINGKFVVNK
ncbi:MAG: T9SS type A sorting domain-containing protein [Candidatus Kapabacteria bacterium]|nr:T9SS type A sorting domain-containing protein [Candidatus Kapabacteria bacterium]